MSDIAGECRLGCLPLETIVLDIWIWHGHILGMAKLFEGFRTGRACESHALQMTVPSTRLHLRLQNQRIAAICQRRLLLEGQMASRHTRMASRWRKLQ